MLPKHQRPQSNPERPPIKRALFNRVVQLKAEGFSWDDIAAEVGLSAAEIQRYPERRPDAWDTELARLTRRATLTSIVQLLAHLQVLTSTTTDVQTLKTSADTLVTLLQQQQPPKPKRTRQPRAPKVTPATKKPVTSPTPVHTALPMIETPPPVAPPALPEAPPPTAEVAPTTSLPAEQPKRPWIATLRRRVQQIRATVSRWLRAVTPRFSLRC